MRHWWLKGLFAILGIWLALHVFIIANRVFIAMGLAPGQAAARINSLSEFLEQKNVLIIPESLIGKLLLIILLLTFFDSGRKFLFTLLRYTWSFLSKLPGKQSLNLAKRYLNIGRFSFYKNQFQIYGRLRHQYPAGSKFIVLPMDMEFMEAGSLKPGFKYADQMEELRQMKQRPKYKDNFFPFVFADPRRFAEEGKSHFDFCIENEKVVLKECYIRTFIELNLFSGFKIYPALGYYPFDEKLLPLWKYAADNGLPIITHCIRGSIFYRGIKRKEWNYHPVFEQTNGGGNYSALELLEVENSEFINNFTHPLNYLCLLQEKLLRKLVAKAIDPRIQEIFGFVDESTPLKQNLSHLKICFGHFGGDDEWMKFLEMDRDNYSSQLVRRPFQGIDFMKKEGSSKDSPGKLEQIWKYADWYSIICSMMLQYEHVYADLSYIIHNNGIQPLLRQTLLNVKIREKVLFGTDFYVVRNHKSEKSMLAEIMGGINEADFDQIARVNPDRFLQNNLHGRGNKTGQRAAL